MIYFPISRKLPCFPTDSKILSLYLWLYHYHNYIYVYFYDDFFWALGTEITLPCLFMYIVKSLFFSLPLFGVIATIFSDNTDYDL